MALIICPECENKISDKATACIYCGFPIAEFTTNITTDKIEEPSNSCCTINGVCLDLHEFLEYVNDCFHEHNCVTQDERNELIECLAEDCDHVGITTVAKIIDIIINTQKIPEIYETFGYKKWMEREAEEAARKEKLSSMQESLPRCPKCDSTSITTGARGYSMVWGFIGSGKTVNRCANCGHKWEPKR